MGILYLIGVGVDYKVDWNIVLSCTVTELCLAWCEGDERVRPTHTTITCKYEDNFILWTDSVIVFYVSTKL